VGSVPVKAGRCPLTGKIKADAAAMLDEESTAATVDESMVILPEVSQLMDPSSTSLVADAVLVLMG